MSGTVLLRPYRGRADLAGMAAVINAVMDAEGGADHATVPDMIHDYEHRDRFDPDHDAVVAEIAGEIVGYGRTLWDEVAGGHREYWVIARAHPDHPGLLDPLTDWVEARSAAVAATHPPGDKYWVSWSDESLGWAGFLRRRGYARVRLGATLVRPHLDEIPHRPLPPGTEVRPVEEAHLRRIWEADVEAFRDHWGYVEQGEADWERWLTSPHWDPSLWQVAWAGDRVVGQVRTYVDEAENRRLGIRRGWTEDISTARDWRGRGIASALICSSLESLRERGFTEAALGVDTENPTGAFRLYQGLGYRLVRSYGSYRRRLPA